MISSLSVEAKKSAEKDKNERARNFLAQIIESSVVPPRNIVYDNPKRIVHDK